MALAQLNLARMRWRRDDPRMAGFVDNIARMQALAERSPGFLWREEDKEGLFPDDPRMTWTLSAWESAEALADFAFRTVHVRFFTRRGEWFEKLDQPWIVFWNFTAGEWPSTDEALDRLARLRRMGPTPEAFGWESLPQAKIHRPVSAEMAVIGTGAGVATGAAPRSGEGDAVAAGQ